MAILCCSPLATKEDLPRKVLEEIEKYEIPVNGGTEDDEDDEDAVLAPPATLNAFLEEWTCLEQTLKRTGWLYLKITTMNPHPTLMRVHR